MPPSPAPAKASGVHAKPPDQSESPAEEVGFEPTMPCGIPVFKTGAFDRSATPPGQPEDRKICGV